MRNKKLPTMEDSEDEERVSVSTIHEVLGSKRSIELQLLSFMLVFSASGLVPLFDLSFPIFVSIYTFLLAKFVFPCYPMEASRMDVFHGSRAFHMYILVGAFLSFFLPFGFVLGSFSRGEPKAVQAATPHLFLSTAQMVSEIVVSGHTKLSPPCRVILTLLYSSRRLSALTHWMVESFSYGPPQPPKWHDLMWLWFGRGLPMANFLYCNIYMFYFLIPKFLLRAFERHISAKRAYHTSTHDDGNRTSARLALTLEDEKKHVAKDRENALENANKRSNTGLEKEKESFNNEKEALTLVHLKDNKVTGKGIVLTCK
ncbi:hypothetical protein GOP47_0006281 [Adiantum capillus-veneris]|uniref:DUF7733 domain-containing protein n=1 Tax=Adiantum capillus-veneris TaxID=13818 RepID=A0A9D4ZMW2_ADICA|nr:hypothetical protein GOP47_0006281 [Adiantum capillus-veneris]